MGSDEAEYADLRATAYHEAGHAVSSALFDIPFTTVEVFTDAHPQPEAEGSQRPLSGIVRSDDLCHFKWPVWGLVREDLNRKAAFLNADQRIMMLHAGPIAESIYIGHKAPACVGTYDRADIRCICRDLLLLTPAATKKRTARLDVATRALLETPSVWDAVVRVAEALLSKNILTQDEVRVLVNSTQHQNTKTGTWSINELDGVTDYQSAILKQ
jgi:hypothetical protein